MTSISVSTPGNVGGGVVDRVASPSSSMVRGILLAYLVLLHVVPISNMLGLGALVPGTVLVLVFSGLCIWLALTYAVMCIGAGAQRFSALDALIGIYALYCIASFFLYLQPGHPA